LENSREVEIGGIMFLGQGSMLPKLRLLKKQHLDLDLELLPEVEQIK
jgi:hypothetical protein